MESIRIPTYSRLTKIIRIEFSERVESETDSVLCRRKTDVPEEGGDDGRVLAVRVDAQETVDLIDGVL